MVTLLSEIRRKARKEHRCGLCNCKINPGEEYIVQTCVDGDVPYTFKMHPNCQTVSNGFMDGYDDEYNDAYFQEDINDWWRLADKGTRPSEGEWNKMSYKEKADYIFNS